MNTNEQLTAENLKNIMSGLPVPLTIITAEYQGQKRAVTISSFTCHSMSPPLITFNIDCSSQFYDIIKNSSHFAVHFPTQKNIDLCRHLAQKGKTSEEQFSIINYFQNEYGTPIIDDITAVLSCTKENTIQIGDHIILVGRVLTAKKTEATSGLLYHQKAFVAL